MNAWILKNREIIPVDTRAWAEWFERCFEERIVAQTDVEGSEVSTVFVGIDHGFGRSREPVLFETMVFGGPLDEAQERYCTLEEAEAGHARWVEKARAAAAT